ncbi:4-hydroxy-tetrahydrodipicolinate reductase [soil metagenome]
MEDRLRLVVNGATGRMGKALAALIEEDESIELLGGVGRSTYGPSGSAMAGFPAVQSPEEAEWLLRQADAVIDFSSPELFRRLLAAQRKLLAGRALVVGTTGLAQEDLALLEEISSATPVLCAPNFSIGVNLLVALAERVAAVLGPEYDVEIVEAHHRRKADAPSGTALQLGNAVARGHESALPEVRRDGRSGHSGERPRGEIGFHAVRGGDIVGEHRVMFIGGRERIELGHIASERALFAEGALRAARWLAGRPPRLYSMRDVLGIA